MLILNILAANVLPDHFEHPIRAMKIVLKGTTLVLDLYHDSATDTHRRILALNPMMVNLKLE